jgi:quercetin 2,3-dioxygenase
VSFSRRTVLVGAASAVSWACQGKRRAPETVRREDAAAASEILHRIESVSAIDGAGATVQRIFPTPQLRHLDPFVLLDDFDVREPAGFPEHPHRGFEAFTYMIQGGFHHTDNLGNDSTIGSGGTQRFNSGRGARHSEMPATAGSNRGLQLWVNLPRAKKAMDPEYAGVAGDAMPVQEDRDFRTHVVVGEGSPVALHTEVNYLDVTLLADATWERRLDAGYSTLVYALEGTLQVGEAEIQRGTALIVGPGDLVVRAREGSRFAFLHGRPHGEPIRHRGPFVD